MPPMAARSRSLRLKRPQKDAGPPQVSHPRLVSDAEHRADTQFVHKDAPKRADSGFDSADDPPRPRTANSARERNHALYMKGAPIVVTADEQTFDFPTPSPKAILEARELRGEQTIGLAMGSPTKASPTKLSPAPSGLRHASTNLANVTNADSLPGPPAVPEAAKPKHSRWKSIFGRKSSLPPPHQTTPDASKQNAIPPRKDSHQKATLAELAPLGTGSPSRKDCAKGRGIRSQSRETPQKRPELPRSKSEAPRSRAISQSAKDKPTGLRRPNPPRLDTSKTQPATHFGRSPTPPPKDRSASTPTNPTITMSAVEQLEIPEWPRPKTSEKSPVANSPRLDVDIPNIEMERYSVMFGNLLSSMNSNRQSLFMRRQGPQQKLKPLNEDSLRRADMSLSQYEAAAREQKHEHEPLPSPRRPRRATSPATPTFSFSLFPSARDSFSPRPGQNAEPSLVRAASPFRPPAPRRSNTAPMVMSPSRSTFSSPTLPLSRSKPRMVHSKLVEELPTPASPPAPRASFDSASTAHDDEDDDADSLLSEPADGGLDTADWEILNAPRPSTEPEPASLRGPVNLKKRAEEVQAAAKLAIARQVSLSRQHTERETRRARRAQAGGAGAGGAAGGRREMEPLEERFGVGVRRVGTPTIVEMGARKSVAVQIMDA